MRAVHAFRLALDKIAALVGLATKPRRPPVPERYALPGISLPGSS